MATKQEMESAIARILPKLTKQQLSQILLLAQAWSNGISLINIEQQPIEIQKLASAIKELRLLNEGLELKNYQLTEELKESRIQIFNKNELLKKLITDSRKLKNQLFMQPGVRK